MAKKQKKKDEIIEEVLPKDYIGREQFVQNITDIIKAANTDRSWTFAINGAWGIGKSFVLNMLERKLNEEECVVVKYDAWKNDFYQDPLIAILHNVLDGIETSNRCKELFKGTKNGILAFYELIKIIPFIESVDDKAKKAFKQLSKDNKYNQLKIAEDFVSFNDALGLVKQHLRKITEKQKLVILVDELDRCEPDYSLTVLNRLHNLFDVPNVVVIVAVNKQQLENIIKSKYNTDKYLEKFFDLSFTLLTNGVEDIRIGYADQFVRTCLLGKELEQAELFRIILKSYLSRGARQVVKFFEILTFITKNIEDVDKKYAYVCLYSYILLNKDLRPCFYTNFGLNSGVLNENTVIDTSYNSSPANHFFHSDIEEYLKSNTYGSSNNLIVNYKDKSINLFLGLINLTYFINDSNILSSIEKWFGVQYSEDDINGIKDAIALIKLLNKGQI